LSIEKVPTYTTDDDKISQKGPSVESEHTKVAEDVDELSVSQCHSSSGFGITEEEEIYRLPQMIDFEADDDDNSIPENIELPPRNNMMTYEATDNNEVADEENSTRHPVVKQRGISTA
jgi:hypothetical protein